MTVFYYNFLHDRVHELFDDLRVDFLDEFVELYEAFILELMRNYED